MATGPDLSPQEPSEVFARRSRLGIAAFVLATTGLLTAFISMAIGAILESQPKRPDIDHPPLAACIVGFLGGTAASVLAFLLAIAALSQRNRERGHAVKALVFCTTLFVLIAIAIGMAVVSSPPPR